MQLTPVRQTKGRKPKEVALRKMPAASAPKKVDTAASRSRSSATVSATKATTTRKAIADAVQQYMADHYGSLIALSALASGPELEAMFAEIDRNLDASEQCTARLLAAQD